jgi:hypothetical protein
MTKPYDKFDPELVQARWVLGGIDPDGLPDLGAIALQQGFEGTALQQLAGLVKPTRADLENLPERAFAEMGLRPLDKEAAVSLLISRGIPAPNATIAVLLEAFPDIGPRWRAHIAFWGGKPAGPYNDASQFVHFVVEDLYEHGKRDELIRIFSLLEKLLLAADEETTNLIGIGFFETLQNFASWRPYGNKVFEKYFGPRSMQIWHEIQRIWAGKSSLMEVIRAERKNQS